jgi:ATPase family associated with various cellular activities (AAA)
MSEISIAGSVATPIPVTERGTSGAILARIRAHALLHATWMERLWSEGQTSPDQGLAITPAEVYRILSHPDLRAKSFDQFLEESESRALLAATFDADEALAVDPFWKHLVELFDLSILEQDLLCLITAVEIDPALGRVFAYLADDTRATVPTLLLTATLFHKTAGSSAADLALSNIRRWRLAHPLTDGPAWRVSTAWQADEALVRSIREERWLDPVLEPWCAIIESDAVATLPILYPDLLIQMQAQIEVRMNVQAQGAADPPSELALAGPEGSGRQTLAAQLSANFGRLMLAVNTPALLAGSRPTSVSDYKDDLIRTVRLAHARQAFLYWRSPDAIASADWTELRSLARISITGVRSIPSTATWGAMLPPLPTQKRFELWRHLTHAPIPPMLKTQRLSPAEVRLSAAAPDAAAALARSAPRASDLLNILPCPYTWDDLVVAPDLSRALHDLESQVRLRWEVYEEWGFNQLTHLGQGISALFGGPSGTGKTMAAQVLARSLDLTLYRVDLAGVVNKYIGETEKRLRDVFDGCERSGVMLFFDEADALFGSRFQAKEAHDRFANIEIDYLLQRIEQFDGIAILATNRKNDLDTAFLRRLRFVCDFLPPGKAERLDLWRRALPAISPFREEILGEIDFQGLAEHIELNGAQIKAIALGAAFLARGEGTKINMQHIELAAAREMSKQGMRLRQPFAKPPRI